MELYRITRYPHRDDLSGTEAFKSGGRWNTEGRHALYTASSRSLALLEKLVHLEETPPPDDYVMVVIHVPDEVSCRQLEDLPADWTSQRSWTEDAGNRWLDENKTLLLKVPSVIVPLEYNYILNPQHGDMKLVKVVGVEPFTIDERLSTYEQ